MIILITMDTITHTIMLMITKMNFSLRTTMLLMITPHMPVIVMVTMTCQLLKVKVKDQILFELLCFSCSNTYPLSNVDDPNKKLNRGEKKCRKALIKLGMKQLTGINRVTLKKRDGLIFVINDPEVLKNTTNDQSYAVFGELKLEDPNSKIASD